MKTRYANFEITWFGDIVLDRPRFMYLLLSGDEYTPLFSLD